MTQASLLAALREIANAGCKFDHGGKYSQWVVDIARRAIREHAEAESAPIDEREVFEAWVLSIYSEARFTDKYGVDQRYQEPTTATFWRAWQERARIAHEQPFVPDLEAALREIVRVHDENVVKNPNDVWQHRLASIARIALHKVSAPDSAQGRAVAWRFKNTIDSEWMVSFSHPVDRWNIIEPLYAAPLPSAECIPEPVAHRKHWYLVTDSSTGKWVFDSEQEAMESVAGWVRDCPQFGPYTVTILMEPSPSAARPVTPCTREEAVEIAKRAEVITPDIRSASKVDRSGGESMTAPLADRIRAVLALAAKDLRIIETPYPHGHDPIWQMAALLRECLADDGRISVKVDDLMALEARISGGLCYFSLNAKHRQLKDAMQKLHEIMGEHALLRPLPAAPGAKS